MADDVKEDLISEPDNGNSLAESFANERRKSGKVNLWSPMKKLLLKAWRMAGNVTKVTTGDKICGAAGVQISRSPNVACYLNQDKKLT